MIGYPLLLIFFSLVPMTKDQNSQAVRRHWTAAISLPFPHPLNFRNRMYLNSISTFPHRITKLLQTHLTGTVAYRGGCFRGK